MTKDPLAYRIDLVEAKVGSPICLVVGAMDGLSFDTLGPRIQKQNWRAVMVEPMPDAYGKLIRNFTDCTNVTFVNRAVTKKKNSVTTMTYVNPEVYDKDPNNSWMEGVSTLNPSVGDVSNLPEEFLSYATVIGTTLEDIMETTDLTNVNIFQIDTEGYDVKVLLQFPFDRIQPELVIFEYAHVSVNEYRVAVNLLTTLGYSCVEIGGDLVASRGV